jgi:plastocyanin
MFARTLLLLLIPAIAGQTQTTSNGMVPGTEPKTVEVIVEHNVFNDGKPLRIHAGDSVIWVNKDEMPHTATSTDASGQAFDTGFIRPGEASEPIAFLKESGPTGFPYECDVHDAVIMKGIVVVEGAASPMRHESPSIHSMLVLGKSGSDIFLHHYDLFNNPNHSYHVTLEASIPDPSQRKIYEEYHRTNGDAMVSIDPEVFFLREIADGSRKSFLAKFSGPAVRGGTPSQWGTVIPGLENVKIQIKRIIQFRAFDPNAIYPDLLTYQLFGNDTEVFMAHEVTAGPSFQHVVALKQVPAFLTHDLIQSSPLVTIEGKNIKGDGTKTYKVAVLSNSTHILLSAPVGSINPSLPLGEDEVLSVHIGGEKQARQLIVGKSIWSDFRILNR